jgi:hypothetical protein
LRVSGLRRNGQKRASANVSAGLCDRYTMAETISAFNMAEGGSLPGFPVE